jgi:hypothetical protein
MSFILFNFLISYAILLKIYRSLYFCTAHNNEKTNILIVLCIGYLKADKMYNDYYLGNGWTRLTSWNLENQMPNYCHIILFACGHVWAWTYTTEIRASNLGYYASTSSVNVCLMFPFNSNLTIHLLRLNRMIARTSKHFSIVQGRPFNCHGLVRIVNAIMWGLSGRVYQTVLSERVYPDMVL